MIENGLDLFPGDGSEVVDELVDGRAVLEGIEEARHRQPVFLKIQAPLTLSGRRSMASQLSQWLMVLSPSRVALGEVSEFITGRLERGARHLEAGVGACGQHLIR